MTAFKAILFGAATTAALIGLIPKRRTDNAIRNHLMAAVVGILVTLSLTLVKWHSG